MKAKLNDGQLDKILWCIDNESEYIEKSDEYFSFDGIAPKKPKNIIRIRKEKVGNANKCIFSTEAVVKMMDTVKNVLAGNVHPFANVEPDKEQTWLTVKAKNTDASGIETNEETEGQLFEGSGEAFRKSMEITHFKTYFTKFKRSFSFYVRNEKEEFNRFVMHAELVSVDGVGPYLEIESVVKEKNAAEASDQIKWFFEHKLGITEFDGRSWVDIVSQK